MATRQETVGALLQHWRRARHLSQLALATEAQVSARHLSFVETGRATPSREMVLRLARVLDVPLRERNALLLAAGFAPLYLESKLDAPALAAVRGALAAILKQQEPFPAVVMNRHWDIVDNNEAATRFFQFLLGARPSSAQPANVLRMMFHPDALRPCVANWEEVAASLVARVRHECIGGIPDGPTRDLLEEILRYPGVPPSLRHADPVTPTLPVVPVSFSKGGRRYDFFSTVTTLGTARDVTVQELRIECFFPADAETERAVRQGADW
jgi:transcriptional regulator with XRE-family HTH domain